MAVSMLMNGHLTKRTCLTIFSDHGSLSISAVDLLISILFPLQSCSFSFAVLFFFLFFLLLFPADLPFFSFPLLSISPFCFPLLSISPFFDSISYENRVRVLPMEVCSICLDNFHPGIKVCILPECNLDSFRFSCVSLALVNSINLVSLLLVK